MNLTSPSLSIFFSLIAQLAIASPDCAKQKPAQKFFDQLGLGSEIRIILGHVENQINIDSEKEGLSRITLPPTTTHIEAERLWGLGRKLIFPVSPISETQGVHIRYRLNKKEHLGLRISHLLLPTTDSGLVDLFSEDGKFWLHGQPDVVKNYQSNDGIFLADVHHTQWGSLTIWLADSYQMKNASSLDAHLHSEFRDNSELTNLFFGSRIDVCVFFLSPVTSPREE